MNLEIISFALALLVGGICFFLVKRTADEFDRWYTGEGQALALRVPVVVSALTVLAAVAVIGLMR